MLIQFKQDGYWINPNHIIAVKVVDEKLILITDPKWDTIGFADWWEYNIDVLTSDAKLWLRDNCKGIKLPTKRNYIRVQE